MCTVYDQMITYVALPQQQIPLVNTSLETHTQTHTLILSFSHMHTIINTHIHTLAVTQHLSFTHAHTHAHKPTQKTQAVVISTI